MGMFDYLKCEYVLPVNGFEGCTFQTKDTPDQFMSDYIISKEGRLLFQEYEIHEVPEEKRPYYKEYKETGKKGLLFIGSIKRNLLDLIDTNYHGDIRFYGLQIEDDTSSGLVTFTARFTNGNLQYIKRVEE